jgi:phosphoenolpyruvate-protein kinase (PTS system EI component)
MGPPAIASVKRAVRATDLERASALAERALACDTAAEVRAVLAEG